MSNITQEDDWMNDLVKSSKKMVYYIANRFRFFDNDFEEILGWCFLGLAEAIRIYETKPEFKFSTIAFPAMKQALYSHYKKSKQCCNSWISLQTQIGKDDKTTDFQDLIPDHKGLGVSDKEIIKIIEEAIFHENDVFREIILDYYVHDKDKQEISKRCNQPVGKVSKDIKRGEALIKQWLVNNDIISDAYFNGCPNKKVEAKMQNINASYYGKIKYLTLNFDFLKRHDIARILGIWPYALSTFLDYPTAKYLLAEPDPTIEKKAIKYCRKKYPERLPSEVTTYKLS
ncbi:MAG: hypothetical protein K0S25_651 [Bacillus sp. (in: firmicutes)]|jgi:RNA polymerase sporulation-specific sigma factor|nr:hypothetical protein [Bacillus sp. (in: firmicutes)]